jgi:hypothetical protein
MNRIRFGASQEQRRSGKEPTTSAQLLIAWIAAAAVLLLGPADAHALPSFARQTGLACSACHTTFPELTPLGRTFKLHGYTTLALKDAFTEDGSDNTPPLEINRTFPLSVMFQTSLTRTNEQQPGKQNASVEFPQQLSLFLSGEITPHIGTFLQATYRGLDGSFTLDNTDIRFANDTQIDGRELLYGATLNNNPTVEDPWNSLPAWGYPFASADAAPQPDAAALVDGVLAQQVAGLGGYAFWNKHLYGDVTVYRSAQINPPQPVTIRNVAPYWRLAWQQNVGANYFEVGTYGLFAEVFPENTPSGPTDKYTDAAVDAQYERPLGADFLSAHFNYIYQYENLSATHSMGGSSNENNHLNTLRMDAIYHWRSQLAFYLQWFLINGSTDALLYAPPTVSPGSPAPVTGSASGSPNSDGLKFEIAYYPWQNVRFSAMYTVYTQFNGAFNNYNGTGRSASANDTLYLLVWLNY